MPGSGSQGDPQRSTGSKRKSIPPPDYKAAHTTAVNIQSLYNCVIGDIRKMRLALAYQQYIRWTSGTHAYLNYRAVKLPCQDERISALLQEFTRVDAACVNAHHQVVKTNQAAEAYIKIYTEGPRCYHSCTRQAVSFLRTKRYSSI